MPAASLILSQFWTISINAIVIAVNTAPIGLAAIKAVKICQAVITPFTNPIILDIPAPINKIVFIITAAPAKTPIHCKIYGMLPFTYSIITKNISLSFAHAFDSFAATSSPLPNMPQNSPNEDLPPLIYTYKSSINKDTASTAAATAINIHVNGLASAAAPIFIIAGSNTAVSTAAIPEITARKNTSCSLINNTNSTILSVSHVKGGSTNRIITVDILFNTCIKSLIALPIFVAIALSSAVYTPNSFWRATSSSTDIEPCFNKSSVPLSIPNDDVNAWNRAGSIVSATRASSCIISIDDLILPLLSLADMPS